jgi:tRNA1Val (adenine37-N6)-methyltransferase
LIIADLLKPREIVALEIDSAMAELINRNASSNGLGKISAICGDFRQRHLSGIAPGSFDAVVANPPYRAAGSGRQSPNPARQTARQEEQGVLADFVKGAAKYAKFGGVAVMVMTASRGAELISLMRLSALEPKRMRLVHPRIETPASVLLIEARRGGGVGVTIEPPLVIYSKKGLYTEETRNLLGVDSPIE